MTVTGIRTWRLDHGWSQKRLAAEIGVSVDVIRNIEKTGARPQPANALKVAEYFDCKPSDMFRDDDATPSELAA